MNTHLRHVPSWQQLAQDAKWSVKQMARMCQVSVRTLELHFLREMAKSPKQWITEQRMEEAKLCLAEGFFVKEVAERLGYKSADHFSREFKKYWNFCPTQLSSADGKFRVSS